ncbi:endonuclease/exonuclease/phosphatase family protein [Vibrio sp. B1Z05]|uniref:endonuclease/exonuclease/phosphatase family protein n=1 Tax=Vibrio sp. B1Z05 TaxID=2654980 RepID=UPI0020A6BCD5|nr:endonuclease/exonuclease/phosphatase family protein [Vibrio sp. B1Z05]
MKLAETSNLGYREGMRCAYHMDKDTLALHQFKISTFNLFNYLSPPGAYYDFENIYSIDQWQDKQRWTLDQIKLSDADIIGFQEIFSPLPLQEQLLDLGYHHFSVIDEPTIEDEFIYSEPVVGIASRYPIVSANPVIADTLASQELGFAFSRAPLHAVIELPMIGKVDVFVVHFKSQRPKALTVPNEHLLEVERWRSTMQRGLEARFLSAFMAERKAEIGYPQVLLGDFNRDLHSAEFSTLTLDEQQLQTGGYQSSGYLQDAKGLLATPIEPIPTHYYGAKGNILDYVLLSEEFDRASASCLYEVSEYLVSDSHLINPIYAIDRMASDHGIVTVTLTQQ